MSQDHKTLVTEAMSGNPRAMDSLLTDNLARLRAFIRLRVGRGGRQLESCSDLVQSVVREALGDADRFEYRGEGMFRAWLYNKALFKIRDRLRYHKSKKRDVGREVPLASDATAYGAFYADFVTPSRHAINHEALESIEAAFDQLPEDHREVITLARIVGLSHREIGERMGRSEEASRALLKRAVVGLSWILTRGGQPDQDGG